MKFKKDIKFQYIYHETDDYDNRILKIFNILLPQAELIEIIKSEGACEQENKEEGA